MILRRVYVRRDLSLRRLDHSADGGKSHDRAGFGDDDVGEICETAVSLARGRIGQHGDKRHGRFPEFVGGGDRFGHLHQRQNALLGPRPTAGNQGDDGKVATGGVLESQGDFFADDAAHAAAHEPVVQDDKHHVPAVDFAGSGDRGLSQAGAVLTLRELIGVRGTVGERQRRDGAHVAVVLAECATIRQQLDPFTGRQSVVETAIRTDPEIEVGLGIADRFVAVQAMVVHCRQVHLLQLVPVAEEVHQEIGQVADRHLNPSFSCRKKPTAVYGRIQSAFAGPKAVSVTSPLYTKAISSNPGMRCESYGDCGSGDAVPQPDRRSLPINPRYSANLPTTSVTRIRRWRVGDRTG